MKNNFLLTLLAFVFILATTKISAQWTKTVLPDPPGGHGALPGRVISLAADGSNVYAGTLGGNFYMSQDNGGSWTYIDSGLTNSDITSILFFKNKVFISTYGSGIFSTSDNGKNWTQSGTTLSNNLVYCFAVMDSDLFVGTWGGGVFQSTDDGTTWKQMNTGLGNQYVRSLGVKGQRLLAGTWGDGIYYTDDKGSSWTQSNFGINKLFIYTIVGDGPNVYLGNDEGVYQSINDGFSWNLMNAGLTNTYVRALVILHPNLIVGTSGDGVFVSTNTGSSWAVEDTGLTDGYIYCLAVSGSKIFAGAPNGEVWSRNLSDVITSVENNMKGIIADNFSLDQNYPNPFNPSTNISYRLPHSGFVTLKVFDAVGREVKTLVQGSQSGGLHSFSFDASSLSSGVYFYRLSLTSPGSAGGSYTSVKKMILLK